MQNAVAFSNNDVITIAWSYDRKPTGCMGFAVYRIDESGAEEALPSGAVFKGFVKKKGQTTRQFPIQKFYWKDVYARLTAERTGNRKFRYRIVPLEGDPGNLTPMTTLPQVISNEVEISPSVSKEMSVYFNRGLISTQSVSAYRKSHPDQKDLRTVVSDPKNPLRASLSGDMVEALTGFLSLAETEGTIYAALYELEDEQLKDGLAALGKRLRIVLSNAVRENEEKDEKGNVIKRTKYDGNDPARQLLHGTAHTVIDRIMPSNSIGHNKFLIYVDAADVPRTVLLGSTNWTSTGLCTQTNNTMIVEDTRLAKRYLDYWHLLAADTKDANGKRCKMQGPDLRTWDKKSVTLDFAECTRLQSWFSPNTPSRRGGKKEVCPPDMAAVIRHIDAAKHSILFLAFYPGRPSIANWTASAARRNKDLFVRGCVTHKSASEGFYYQLTGKEPPVRTKGSHIPYKEDYRVIGAEALNGRDIPEGWMKELLSVGHAIVHDKILVIDPFSPDCVVITGSHNLGYRASFNNDENMVIVKGNRKLALAYATHVLDVYDHFSWRSRIKREGTKDCDPVLRGTPDEWLNKYYDRNGQIKLAQLDFWMSAVAM